MTAVYPAHLDHLAVLVLLASPVPLVCPVCQACLECHPTYAVKRRLHLASPVLKVLLDPLVLLALLVVPDLKDLLVVAVITPQLDHLDLPVPKDLLATLDLTDLLVSPAPLLHHRHPNPASLDLKAIPAALDHPEHLVNLAEMAHPDSPETKDPQAHPANPERPVNPVNPDLPDLQALKVNGVFVRNIALSTVAYSLKMVHGDDKNPSNNDPLSSLYSIPFVLSLGLYPFFLSVTKQI